MLSLILHILGNSIAIYLAARFIEGVSFTGDILDLLIAGIVIGLLNFFIKPILKIISAPLILLTLGLFIFIINIFILWLAQYILLSLTIQGFWAYFWTLILITFINLLISHYHNSKQE